MLKNEAVLKNRQDAEIFLNVLVIGILTAFHNGKITVDDGRHLLFRPGVIDYLEKQSRSVNQSLIFYGYVRN